MSIWIPSVALLRLVIVLGSLLFWFGFRGYSMQLFVVEKHHEQLYKRVPCDSMAW